MGAWIFFDGSSQGKNHGVALVLCFSYLTHFFQGKSFVASTPTKMAELSTLFQLVKLALGLGL